MIYATGQTNFEHIQLGIWCPGSKDKFDIQKELVNKYLYKLKGKKVLFIAGGTGKLSNYASILGIDATNLDINPLYINLGKKYYSNIKHITTSMFTYNPKYYDYIFLEDSVKPGFIDNQMFNYINNCMEFTKILPESISMYIYRCNSDILDKAFTCEEYHGNIYTKKALNNGGIRVVADHKDLTNLEIEKLTFYLDSPINFNTIHPIVNKKYTLIGGPGYTFLKNNKDSVLKALTYNKGYRYFLDDTEFLQS
tara:strand:+ start:36 stop:791 length:756 start_codon:yes stop_codon:yes gene_type:complete